MVFLGFLCSASKGSALTGVCVAPPTNNPVGTEVGVAIDETTGCASATAGVGMDWIVGCRGLVGEGASWFSGLTGCIFWSSIIQA